MGAAGRPPVELATTRSIHAPGEVVVVRIDNHTGGTLWVPGCSPLEVQRFEEESFVPLHTEGCASEGVARTLDAGVTELSISPTREMKEGVFRVIMAYGTGCKGGVPLSAAGCRSLGEVVSRSFRIGGGGG